MDGKAACVDNMAMWVSRAFLYMTTRDPCVMYDKLSVYCGILVTLGMESSWCE